MFLKQSTAATLVLGPFVDGTDGVTAETGLTIAQADVRLSKNGGAFAQKNESSSCSHMENGYYACALNTTDTNTLGRLRVAVSKSGALPVWIDATIMAANVYDSLVGGSDKLQVHTDEITAGLITAATIATGAIDADAVASDAVSEIQSGLATASSLSTVAGYIDTEVASILAAVDTEIAAIKTKTDNLPSDPADQSAVEAAIAAALAAIGLDHLLSTSVAGADVADNSIIAKLASKSGTADWDTFDNTSDSLEARADDKAGYILAATGLDAVTVGEVSSGSEPTSITGLIRMIYNRHFRRAELTDTTLKTYEKDAVGGSSGVLTAQTVSDDGTTQIQQQATYP